MSDKRTRVMLANLLKGGELYPYHMKVRTSAARLLKTPAPSSFGTGKGGNSSSSTGVDLPFDDDAKKAAEMLFEGARALLEKGEFGGGTDLTLYLLDVWTARAVPCNDENRKMIQTLIALVGGSGNWRKSIVDHAVAWSARDPETPAGDSALHAYIGQVLYKDRDYPGGEHHYLAAATRDSAKSLASLLFDWSKTDPSASTSSSSSTSSLGRYAARGVLSYLEASSILCATVFIESFLSLCISSSSSLLIERIPLTTWPDKSSKQGEEEEILVTKLPSLNFLQLVIRNCQIGAAEQQVKRPGNSGGTQTIAPGRTAWNQLLTKYGKEVPWLKEEEVKESLSYLGQMYFGIKPASSGNNMLGDLMSSLFGGGGGGAPSAGALPAPGGAGRGRGRGRGAIGAGTPKISQAGLD